ncbi:MAG: hypothetical protein ABR985_08665 [Methanotrichaceae archaeon]|jgi:acetaldehyde dehydrogenase (acetylating)
MTFSTEDFLARNRESKHVDEAHLAEAHIKADKALSEAKIKLISHLSAEKLDGKVVPVFDASVSEVLEALSAAEKEATEVKKMSADILSF